MTTVKAGSATVVSAAAYLPFGPLSGLTYGNAIAESWTHDASYRATGVTDTGTAGAISSLTYTLDAADNVSNIVDGVAGANNQAMSYSTVDRLLTASGAYGGYTWAYDYNGNRTSVQLGAATADSYTYQNEKLYTDTFGSYENYFGYAATGALNLISQHYGSSYYTPSTMTWNQSNRLAQAVLYNYGTAVGTENYIYDGMGSLFSRSTVGPPVTAYQYQYDLNGQLLEEDTSNAAQADYIWLGSRPVGVYSATTGTLSYLHDDRLGTPVKATSSTQATVWSASYLPFGQATITGSIQQNLRYPGQIAGSITGWNINGWRFYDYTQGRYINTDPIDRNGGGGMNIYGYVGQNPFKYVDPSGLQVVPGTPPPPNPPASIPGGPWTWSPNPQNPRGGTYIGPKPITGGQRTQCTYADSKANFNPDPYWKVTQPDGSAQRYDTSGNPITPDQAHPGPSGTSSSSEPAPDPVPTGTNPTEFDGEPIIDIFP